MNKPTHYRKGSKVFSIEGNKLEFDGTPKDVRKGIFDDVSVTYKRGKKTFMCNARFYVNRGINKAKNYVRKNRLVSYNID